MSRWELTVRVCNRVSQIAQCCNERETDSLRKDTATTKFAVKLAVVLIALPAARISRARYSDWYQQRCA